MLSLPSLRLPAFLRSQGDYPSIDLPSVEIHEIETSVERRARTLKHLLKANHANYSIIYHDLRFHNHTPHVRTLSALPAPAAKPQARFSARRTSWEQRTNT